MKVPIVQILGHAPHVNIMNVDLALYTIQRPSSMTIQDWTAFLPLVSMIASLVLLIASFMITVFLLKGKSQVLTYPVKSTWLQKKYQFRVNGAKVIEQGFVEVSMS